MVYVHNSDLKFNAEVYVFMRSWYTPDLDNHTFTNDTWFIVPAIKSETPTRVNYTIINNKVEFSAMMIITDQGRLIRANRISVDNKVHMNEIRRIRQEAFNIPAWELENQKSFPYSTMFDGNRVTERYNAVNGDVGSKAYFSSDSINKLYTDIKRTVSPKPCNCGKAIYIG